MCLKHPEVEMDTTKVGLNLSLNLSSTGAMVWVENKSPTSVSGSRVKNIISVMHSIIFFIKFSIITGSEKMWHFSID